MVQVEEAVLFSKSRRLTTDVYFLGNTAYFAALLQIYTQAYRCILRSPFLTDIALSYGRWNNRTWS